MSHVFTPVVKASEIAEKGFACFDVSGAGIVICRFRDEYFAIENSCSHALSSFEGGRTRGYRIMCPLHGAMFDMRDGSVASAPAKTPIVSYPCRVTNGMVEVCLDHAA